MSTSSEQNWSGHAKFHPSAIHEPASRLRIPASTISAACVTTSIQTGSSPTATYKPTF